jgi:hypothetical protein
MEGRVGLRGPSKANLGLSWALLDVAMFTLRFLGPTKRSAGGPVLRIKPRFREVFVSIKRKRSVNPNALDNIPSSGNVAYPTDSPAGWIVVCLIRAVLASLHGPDWVRDKTVCEMGGIG